MKKRISLEDKIISILKYGFMLKMKYKTDKNKCFILFSNDEKEQRLGGDSKRLSRIISETYNKITKK